jgi:carboxypeptidase family protein
MIRYALWRSWLDTRRQSRVLYALLVCALALLSGCEPSLIVSGRVVDVSGQALPGAAVSASSATGQDVTDGIGTFRLRCAPGPARIDIAKTGYTPGLLEIDPAGERVLELNDILLWPLPTGKGVYLFEDYRYRETARVKPSRYLDKDTGPIFAVKQFAEVTTRETQPLIICHKLPSYDVALYRMGQIEAALPQRSVRSGRGGGGEYEYTLSVWAPVDAVGIFAVPIDEPGRLLLELRPSTPLSPGVYAMHWGALDGHTSTSPNAFLFQVVSAESQEGEGETSTEGPIPEEEAPEAE